jgi:hypothetical protein
MSVDPLKEFVIINHPKGNPNRADGEQHLPGRYRTQYLGPLQQGRMVIPLLLLPLEVVKKRLEQKEQCDFNGTHVILKPVALQAVLAANEGTVFTSEFYPRQADNVVNYTLHVYH